MGLYNLKKIFKRLKNNPYLAEPSKGDPCIICKRAFYSEECGHSMYEIKEAIALANAYEALQSGYYDDGKEAKDKK